MAPITFNSNKHILGSLCKRGHEYKNTGKTLRYKSGTCPLCNKASAKARGPKIPSKYTSPGEKVKVAAVCPRCARRHETRILQGWIGNGTLRKYCPPCQTIVESLIQGDMDYGY